MRDPCKTCLVLPACTRICEQKLFFNDNKERVKEALLQLGWDVLPLVIPAYLITTIIIIIIIIVRGT